MKDDDLRRRLRGAAHTHTPDRERMRARVERGMGGHEAAAAHRAPRPAMSWLRVVSATASVAGVFAVGGYAVASSVSDEDPPPQSVATTSAPVATPTTPPAAPEPLRTSASPTPSAPRPTATPQARRSSAPPKSEPSQSRSPSAADLLWADGSIDPGSRAYWAQSNVTIKAKKPLTALTVELRIARSAEAAETGHWLSLPAEDFEVAVDEDDGFLVYRWSLRAGRTVPVGTHVFAGQYNHPEGGRDAGDDVYTVEAGTTGPPGERDEVRGDFAPTSD
ncbi:hypothetical protein [Streptomyces sp. NPDC058620]|uniref:hypothetical protein n=1 Tax=Streptomyces sp. NPDC058620 TaxID=3346560 RepID=UPI00365EACD6